jgi:Uma2 family endonuclease
MMQRERDTNMATSHIRRTRLPKLRRSSNGMLMTPEEFDAVTDYDDRYRYELIHGVLIVSPFAGPAESDPNEELGHLLRTYRESHSQGSVLDRTLAEYYINLADSRRRADRVIWVGLGRVPEPGKDVPAIVVEFVSKSTRDRVRDYVEKRSNYLGIGVIGRVLRRFVPSSADEKSPPLNRGHRRAYGPQ